MDKKKIAALVVGAALLGTLCGCGGNDTADLDDVKKTAQTDGYDGDTATSKFGGKKINNGTDGDEQESGHKDSADDVIVQSELDDAESFLNADMIDDAKEMLGYIDRESLSENQKEQYDDMMDRLGDDEEDDDDFTPESAVSMVESVYGITIDGDVSEMHSQIDDNGDEYYRMQIEVPSVNQRKIVDVYKDNKIVEISSEPLAFG